MQRDTRACSRATVTKFILSSWHKVGSLTFGGACDRHCVSGVALDAARRKGGVLACDGPSYSKFRV